VTDRKKAAEAAFIVVIPAQAGTHFDFGHRSNMDDRLAPSNWLATIIA